MRKLDVNEASYYKCNSQTDCLFKVHNFWLARGPFVKGVGSFFVAHNVRKLIQVCKILATV